MKRYLFLTAIWIVWLPTCAFGDGYPDPTFGVELQLNHIDNGDDRMDIMICNYTGDTMTWYTQSWTVQACEWWPITTNGFPPGGFTSTLPTYLPGHGLPSDQAWASLSTLKWLHTKKDDPWFTVCFYIGGNPFWLMIYPQHESKILTDLEFAWHVMSAIGDSVEMAYGDEEAALSMQKNVEKAIQEGNEMGDAPNQAWAGISSGGPQNMWYEPAQLTYPIIYQLIDGEYEFDVSSADHIAFDINGLYVVQLVTVNSDSDLTGNPQLVVNVYTRDQWNVQQNP